MKTIEKNGEMKYILRSRKEFPKLFDLNGYQVGAEVGVHKGDFSACILGASKLKTLYSVDPWCNLNGIFVHLPYEKCYNKLKVFGERSKIIVKTSLEASRLFKDNSLDFVYIDADHSYESVRDDINAWSAKIKIGGIVSGHDYLPKGDARCGEYANGNVGTIGVIQAVNEFIEKNKYELNLIPRKGHSWWFFKSH